MDNRPSLLLKKLLAPLVFTLVVLAVFYYGGETYKAFGIAAFDSTQRVLKHVLGVVAFLSIGLLVNRLVVLVLFNMVISRATGFQVPKLLSQITSLFIFIITVAACANIVFNQDLTVLWAASGVAGLVLGMALKELLQDVFAGIALNIDQSVTIGDYVQIHKAGDDKVIGQLKEISWRSTHIKTLNGEMISFPNSKFSAFTITNFTASNITKRTVPVIIDGRVPTARVIRILQSAALDALTELNPSYEGLPSVSIKAIRLDGVEYQIAFKLEFMSQSEASWKIQQAVILHLARAGLKPATNNPHDAYLANTSYGEPDDARLIDLLAATPIFSQVSKEHVSCLVAHSRLRSVAADAIVAQTGEAASELYLVLEGLLISGAGKRSGSTHATTSLLRPGDMFDITASLLGNVHKNTVRARTPCLILEISSGGLHELFNAHSDNMLKIARALVEHDRDLGILWDEEKFDALLIQMRHLFPLKLNFSLNA